jgi:3-methyladenine DNA glycosylase AlkD
MTLAEVMKELEACGSPQYRKTWARHGGEGEMFGVSYANLYRIQKAIKLNQALAEQLWATHNHDAQVLATLIADPQVSSDKQLEAWAKDLSNYGLALMFSQFVAKTPLARKKADKWNKSKEEFIGQAGWEVIAHLALSEQALQDDYFESYLKIIESDIHKRKNRVRYAMNGALIAIGLRNEKLRKQALSVAAKIGKVEVDHGDTNCKTPDATEYIKKSQYRHKKVKRAAK